MKTKRTNTRVDSMPRATNVLKRAVLVVVTALVTACGGGGEPPPSNPAAYTLMGAIEVPVGATTDGDVNDLNAEYFANDDMSSAQILGGTVTVSGYVNLPGVGSEGRSFASGDMVDYYLVDLEAEEQVAVLVANPDRGDIDVRLLDANGTVVDGSVNTGDQERVQAPHAGSYYVEIYPHSGASNYLLSVGHGNALNVMGELRLSAEFVADEAVIRYRSEVPPVSPKGPSHLRTFTVQAGEPGHDQLIHFGADRRTQPMAMTMGDGGGRLQDDGDRLVFASEEQRHKWSTLMAIKSMRAESSVEYVEPNYIVQLDPMFTPSDPAYRDQWHYPLINLPTAWDTTQGSPDVIVAVIDTGVLLSHPDLQGQLVSGYDFVSDPFVSLDGDGIDPNPNDPGDAFPFGGSSFHGTHVCGTIAATTNNGNGVAGVAPHVRCMPVRVLGAQGFGTSWDITQGVRYAAGLSNASGRVPDRRADVINLSLGGTGGSSVEQALYNEVRRQGVIVVASAGNAASSTPNYPASYEGVISVSAVGFDRQLSSYSSFGSSVDVAAPGGDDEDLNGDGWVDGVLSTWADDSAGYIQMGYGFMMGTSMAAPHVAGVVALMKSVNPELTPSDVDRLLADGQLTNDLGAAGRDNDYGYGLIDAAKAVTAAQNGGNPPMTPVISADPESIDFGASGNAVEFSIADNVGDSVRVTEVSSNADWLRVSAVTNSATGLGLYRATIDRSVMVTGPEHATITVRSSANTLEIPVTVRMAGDALADAGVHYVLLIDPETSTTAMTVTVEPVQGSYQYRLNNVPAGDYWIAAGNDPDNDQRICTAGESCGWYGGATTPEVVSVNRSLSGLDVVTEFQASVSIRGVTNGRLAIR